MKTQLDELLHRNAYLALQRMRGRPIDAVVRQLQAWEKLNPAEFRKLAQQRLREALRYAHRNVSLYSTGVWAANLSSRNAEDINAWPTLERQVLRERNSELLSRRKRLGTFYRHSSQSSGPPVHVALNPAAAAWSWGTEYRAMLWHGVPIGVKTLMMWGGRHPLSDWIRNSRIFVTSNFSPEKLEEPARWLLKHRPTLCSGLPSAIAHLARYIRARYPDAPEKLVPYAKLGGEQVYQFQRDEIERHLGAKTIEFYGCTEVGAIAAECPAGSLHVFSEHVHIEIFHGDRPAPPGEFGDIIATSLTNRAMPLVRCRIGDHGRLSLDKCSCGLPHPVLTHLVGRSEDVFVAADGRKVHGSALAEGLRPVLARVEPRAVRQVLFEQMNPHTWNVLVESEAGFEDGLAQELGDVVRETFGGTCRVQVKRVNAIPREPSGKFRYYCRSAGAV